MREMRKNIVSEPIPRYGYEPLDEAWDFIKNNYGAIARHLIKYKAQAEKRLDMGDYWWELRACAYIDEFEKEKIVWKRIGSMLRFQYDEVKSLCLDSACFLVSKKTDIKYLLAIMNSKISFKFLLDNSPKTGTGDVITSVQAVEPLRIPKISESEQKPFIERVEKILLKIGRGENINFLDDEIDLMVYKIYDLSYYECKIVDPDFDSVLSQFGLNAGEYERMRVEELAGIRVEGEFRDEE
jgi:hypothetical protein